MAQAGSIDRYKKLLALEKADVDLHNSVPEAGKVKETRFLARDALKDIGRTGDVGLIVAVERVTLENERAIYANSSGMRNSLDLALKELHGAEVAIGLVQSPDTYRQIDEIYTTPKNRIGGVPRDEARQFFKSHLARLLNQDKSRLSAEEKQIIDIRRSNLRIAEKTYTAQQKQTLGIEADVSKTRGKGPGLGLS